MRPHVERAQVDELLRERPQADVDPLVLGIPEGDVLERVGVEVRLELAVEHVEDVLVELRGDAGGIVVGGLEGGGVLDQVRAEQEAVARVHQGGDPGEERAPGPGAEVADRAAEEGDQRPLGPGDPLEVGLVVADDALDREPRVLVDELAGGPAGDLLGDVDRDEPLERAGVAHRVEENAALGGGAGAELDQRPRPRRRDDRGRSRVAGSRARNGSGSTPAVR